MVLSVLPFSSTQEAAEETSSVGTSNISIGDYIRLGNYNGQPILWRCVDVDEMGPLMLSDQVLATMAYDAKTSENGSTDNTIQIHKTSAVSCFFISSILPFICYVFP